LQKNSNIINSLTQAELFTLTLTRTHKQKSLISIKRECLEICGLQDLIFMLVFKSAGTESIAVRKWPILGDCFSLCLLHPQCLLPRVNTRDEHPKASATCCIPQLQQRCSRHRQSGRTAL